MDVCHPNTNTVDVLSDISVSAIGDHAAEIKNTFGFENIELLMQLKPFSFISREGDYFGQFVPYPIPEHLDEYASQLFGFLGDRFWSYIQARYKKGVDYNEKYGLKPDPILAADELLRPHPFSGSMVRLDGKPVGVEEWQDAVADLQLIPGVPEDVKGTFDVSKRLYVFALFEWRFFTISQHYAFLALEAAVQARWSRTLPDPVTV